MFKRWGILLLVWLVALPVFGQEPTDTPPLDTLDAAFVRADDHYIRSFLNKLSDSLAANDPDNAPDWRSRLYSRFSRLNHLYSRFSRHNHLYSR